MTLYEKVTDMRIKKGYSQSELERISGLSKGTITNWKKRDPNMSSIIKVANALGCDVKYFLDDNEESYYLNDETARIAQRIYEDKDMRTLFDMSSKMTPDRLKAHIEFMKKLQESENQ